MERNDQFAGHPREVLDAAGACLCRVSACDGRARFRVRNEYYYAKKAHETLSSRPKEGSSSTRTKESFGMYAETILRIKPSLTPYLHEFDGCMGRATNRRHLETYVAGQLSDLQRKSIEPMAPQANHPAITRVWHQAEKRTNVSLAKKVA